MNRAFKTIGVLAAAVLVLLVLAALAISFLFDPNDYKNLAAEWVEERSGRQLDIQGDLELSFFPWLAVRTGSLSLSNAEGFQETPFASVESASVGVKLLPLLSGRFQVGTVELDGLILNLARDAEGRGNWEDLAAGKDTAEAGAPETASGALDSVQIAGISLTEATVYWREQVSEVRYVARNLAMETGGLVLGQPVDLTLSGNLLSVAPQANVDLTLSTTVTIGAALDKIAADDVEMTFDVKDGRDVSRARGTVVSAFSGSLQGGTISFGPSQLEALLVEPPGGSGELQAMVSWAAAEVDTGSQTLTVNSLRTDMGGIPASWELKGERLLETPIFTGKVSAQRVSWERVLQLTGSVAPQGVSPSDLGDFDLAADFHYRGDAGTVLDNLRLATLGFVASGHLKMAPTGGVSGRVTIPSFAAGRLIQAIGSALPDDVDTSAIDRLALTTTFDWGPDRGELALRDMTTDLLGGTWAGDITVAGTAGNRSYSGVVRVPRFDGRDFARAFASVLPANLSAAELGPLAANARFRYRAAEDDLTLQELTLEAVGLRASGDLAARSLSDAPRWTGELRTQPFSPRNLMTRFGQAVPDTADSDALTRATVTSKLDVNAQAGRFEALTLSLDDSVITGDFRVTNYADPNYAFTLSIDAIDVDRYLPPKAEDKAADSDVATGDELEIPAQALKNLRLAGQVNVGRMRLAGLSFQQVFTKLQMGDGRAQLDSARTLLYGGQFQGDLNVDASGRIPTMRLTGATTGLALEPLLTALQGEANLSGTGSFDLALSGSGATVMDNVRSAAGSIRFAISDGALKGFNLGSVLCRVYNAQKKLPRPQSDVPDVTTFERLGGTASVREGIANSDDLEAALSFLKVTGGGGLDLANQGLRYDLLATLTANVPIRGCETMDGLIGESIPFTVRGTISEPDIRPDFGKLLERAIRRSIEDRLKEKLLERLGVPPAEEGNGAGTAKQPPQ